MLHAVSSLGYLLYLKESNACMITHHYSFWICLLHQQAKINMTVKNCNYIE